MAQTSWGLTPARYAGYLPTSFTRMHGTTSAIVTRAVLTINAYGLPLFLTDLDVYGFTTTNGQLDATDANVGTFIREITIPTGTVYGQDISIDVTSFVASVNSPYVGFTLRDANGAIGIDSFSSLESNYGHPAQLIVTTVPESEPYVMLATGLGTGVDNKA